MKTTGDGHTMNKIVGVQVGESGKISSFDTGHFVLKKGNWVMVETELGPALGMVVAEPRRWGEEGTPMRLRKVLRLATEKDLERQESNKMMNREIYRFCQKRIKERSLPMLLVGVERLFDGSKVMVYFTADGRVDFRGLVKDLVQKFHTRIEMRQIGVRHQAKMVGGLGNCGRQLCCTGFLDTFDPVSIKMAKEQNLSLNPSKISGMCGRLMCCLAYEYEYYENAKKTIPKVGKRVKTKRGEGRVIRQNILKKTLTVSLDDGEDAEISYEELIQDKPAP